jgi:DnaK suppressor protein
MKHLNPQQIATLRVALDEKLSRLSAYHDHIESESPVNDPDRLENNEAGDDASEAYEILESEALGGISSGMVKEVRAALDRMKDGTYGLDVNTGEPIPYERLLMLPEAKTAHAE